MDRKPILPSIWELDPKSNDEYDYEAVETLFFDAFEHTFGLRATPARVRPYLMRYLRYRVIPPWLRVYVREVRGGESVASVGDAPLDPAIDLKPWAWRGALLFYLVAESRRPHPRGPYFEA